MITMSYTLVVDAPPGLGKPAMVFALNCPDPHHKRGRVHLSGPPEALIIVTRVAVAFDAATFALSFVNLTVEDMKSLVFRIEFLKSHSVKTQHDTFNFRTPAMLSA